MTSVNTIYFESYLKGWRNRIIICGNIIDAYENLVESNKMFIQYENLEDLNLNLNEVITEIRKNLINLSESHLVYNYRNYIQKSFQDLLNLIKQQMDHIVFQSYDIDDVSSEEPPYETMVKLYAGVKTHFEILLIDCIMLQEQLVKECDYEIKLRSKEIVTPKEFAIKKLLWKGELKEFGELIDQLQAKGWIEINDGELKPTVDSICKVFDFSATQKKVNSNSATSLMQYLKTSEREDKIYTKRYSKKFNSILPNTNEKVVTN